MRNIQDLFRNHISWKWYAFSCLATKCSHAIIRGSLRVLTTNARDYIALKINVVYD
jgi:hypothetical protein